VAAREERSGMAANEIPADIRKMSFEQALDELKAIVAKLEQGQGTLDSAIGDYDRGAALKRHCDSKLREAQAKIEKISLSAEGGVGAEALDVE
jgi:exodeoxyribonuclease VII small subunit